MTKTKTIKKMRARGPTTGSPQASRTASQGRVIRALRADLADAKAMYATAQTAAAVAQIERENNADHWVDAVSRAQTAERLLGSLVLDCLTIADGVLQCRHCQRTATLREDLPHDRDCVVGQVVAEQAVKPQPVIHGGLNEHHQALLCPFCNPDGLVLVKPSP